MNPIHNWRWVIQYAWSVRFMVLAALLSGLEVMLSVMASYAIATPIPPGVFASLSGVVTIAAFGARFVAQKRDGSLE